MKIFRAKVQAETVVSFLFFFSGLTSLVYEVLFVRVFGLVFGNTFLAVSTVLSSYMMGMALGGAVLGRAADRTVQPLRLYAVLEGMVGLWALAVFFLRPSIEKLFPVLPHHLFGHHLLQFFTVFVILLPMTAMMGGTLPAVARALIRDRSILGKRIGFLYAVNTSGAMAGVFLAGFVLIGSLGITKTLVLAVLTNIAIAGLAFLLSRSRVFASPHPLAPSPNSSSSPQSPAQPRRIWISYFLNLLKIRRAGPSRYMFLKAPSPDSSSSPQPPVPSPIFIIMFLSGLCGLSYEVLWTRVLVFVTTNSTYAFSIMLITFLAGLALGSLLATRFVDRLKKLSAVLGAVLIAAGGGALLTALLLSLIPAIHDRLFMATPATTWWAWNGIRFLECFLVMVLPTIFLGMSFPLASRLVISGLEGTGTRLGLLSFFNTAGGALGSFLAGAVMVPLLGTAVSLILFFVVHIWVGLSLVFSSSSRWRRPILVLPMFAVFLVFISQGAIREKGFRSAFVHVEKDFQLLDAREGLEGTVTVHRSERLIEPITRLDVDGLNVAGTSFLLNTLQILQAHIPLSICSDAKNVLQIGFGTGQTTASAILHPIARMDLVEISGDVMALSRRHFDHINGRVWTDPRVAVHIGDGKNALKYADRRYDVIMNDANYAVATASASLFTEDHFQNGRKALRSRGFFSTWMTIDLDPADFAVVLATFRSVFPYCTLWMAPNTVNKQVVLIGSADPWDIDLAVLSERFSDPKIKNDLASVNIGSVYDFLDALVLDSEGIRDIAKTAPINRDDRPILEFSRKDIRSRDFCSLQNLGRILARRPDISRMLSGLPRTLEERRIKDDLLRHHRIASRKLFEGMLQAYQGRMSDALRTVLDASRWIPESRLGAEFFASMDRQVRQIEADAAARPDDPDARMERLRYVMQSGRPDADPILRGIVKDFPNDPDVLLEKARWHLARGETDSALWVLEKAVDVSPDPASSWVLLGEVRKARQENDQALNDYRKAVQKDPRHYQALNAAGRLLQSENRVEEALPFFRRSLAVYEYQPETASGIGDCHVKAGRIDSALVWYEKAAKWAPDRPALLSKWATALGLSGQHSRAAALYETALGLDSLDAGIWYNYGNTIAVLGRLERAAGAFRKSVKLDPGNPDAFNNLGMTCRLLGRMRDARRVFEEGLRLHPRNPLLLKNAAEMESSPIP